MIVVSFREVHEEANQAREKASELKLRRQEQAAARREKLKQAYLKKRLENLKAAQTWSDVFVSCCRLLPAQACGSFMALLVHFMVKSRFFMEFTPLNLLCIFSHCFLLLYSTVFYSMTLDYHPSAKTKKEMKINIHMQYSCNMLMSWSFEKFVQELIKWIFEEDLLHIWNNQIYFISKILFKSREGEITTSLLTEAIIPLEHYKTPSNNLENQK